MSVLSPDQFSSVRAKLLAHNTEPDVVNVVSALREVVPTISQSELIAGADLILANTIGLGPIDALINQSGVTDVLVNCYDDVWFDQGNGLEKSSVTFSNESELREFAARLATSVNRRLDDVSPFVDAQLKNGIRFHAIIPPLAKNGTTLSFRIPTKQPMKLSDLVHLKTIDQNIAELLISIINQKISFVVSGATGSGKTTFLSALLNEVNSTERMIIIEDTAELQISHPQVISLQTRNPNAEGIGGIELSQLVKQALRMRPDRLVIGEVRGVEVIDLLVALNTGHRGSCVTIHANNTQSVVARFEALGLLAKTSKAAIYSLLSEAIQVLIHIKQTEQGRKVSEISLLEKQADGVVKVQKALDLIENRKFEPGWQNLQKLLKK
jgi:pilus assembly protein CpaF